MKKKKNQITLKKKEKNTANFLSRHPTFQAEARLSQFPRSRDLLDVLCLFLCSKELRQALERERKKDNQSMDPASRDSGATASSSSSSSSSPSPLQQQQQHQEPESCVKYFDALWFCYSPGHQLKQFYRYGNVDDCTGAWSSLWRCLSKRTARFAPSEQEAAEEEEKRRRRHPLWELRTREEAKAAWDAEFGHLDGSDGGGSGSEGGGTGAGAGGAERKKGGGGGLHARGGEATPAQGPTV